MPKYNYRKKNKKDLDKKITAMHQIYKTKKDILEGKSKDDVTDIVKKVKKLKIKKINKYGG